MLSACLVLIRSQTGQTAVHADASCRCGFSSAVRAWPSFDVRCCEIRISLVHGATVPSHFALASAKATTRTTAIEYLLVCRYREGEHADMRSRRWRLAAKRRSEQPQFLHHPLERNLLARQGAIVLTVAGKWASGGCYERPELGCRSALMGREAARRSASPPGAVWTHAFSAAIRCVAREGGELAARTKGRPGCSEHSSGPFFNGSTTP